jgi:glyoxylase-like metal-dependent hydrolase (beta-lactamase superfamily II)
VRLQTLAAGVYACRHPELELTTGIVLGARRCLVIDSGADEHAGARIAAGLAGLTAATPVLVLTHSHFDHVLGSAALGADEVLAHPECAQAIARDLEPERGAWLERFAHDGQAERARRLGEARVVPPSRTVTDEWLSLGDRWVRVCHPGRGHTGGDLVVHVPDAATVFAGDLVEQSGPPQAGPDSDPDRWPSTLEALLALDAAVIVPGHGEPVGPAFVRAQQAELRKRVTRSRARPSGCA